MKRAAIAAIALLAACGGDVIPPDHAVPCEHSSRRTWYDNGSPKTHSCYCDGTPCGCWSEWYATGRLHWRGCYEEGQPCGTWTETTPDGHVLEDYHEPCRGDK